MEEYKSRLKCDEIDRLFDAVLRLDNVEECYRFFEDLCTIPELKSIAQRWMVALALNSGEKYQDISHRFGASTATISRVNRCLEYGAGGYRLMIDKIDTED